VGVKRGGGYFMGSGVEASEAGWLEVLVLVGMSMTSRAGMGTR